MTVSERVKREQEFHDQRFAASEDRRSSRFYAITERSLAAHQRQVEAIGPDATVLEIGCGDTAVIWQLADGRRRCIGIDISPVAVDKAREDGERRGVEGVEFHAMNAEELEFPDGSIDVVIGNGILHHLDLEVAIPEVARVLAADGVGLFVEPMGHNPVVNAYRRLTPGERTEDEHPFLRRDLTALREWFDSVDLQFFHMLSLGAIPFIGSDSFENVLRRLEAMDEWILRRSRIAQNLAWIVTMELRGPKVLKGSTTS